MSVHRLGDLRCARCGWSRPARVVDSANPVRHPAFLAGLLDRTLNRFPCRRCKHVDVVEQPMLWTDVPRHLVAAMFPSSDRPMWSALELAVEAELRRPVRTEGPAFVRSWGAAAAIRLVFGLEELRDKVIASLARVDDRVVEVLKVPFIDAEQAVAPVLEMVDDHGLHLATPVPANGVDREGSTGRVVAVVSWDDYRRCAAEHVDAAMPDPGLFGGTWVHCLRAAFAPAAS